MTFSPFPLNICFLSIILTVVLTSTTLSFLVPPYDQSLIHPHRVAQENDSAVPEALRYRINPNSKSASLSDRPRWPPVKLFVYPEDPYHTTGCLYAPDMPTRYVNTTGYWFQRMLEPTVHHQFLHAPIRVSSPEEADIFLIPHYSRMCSGYDGETRWNSLPACLNSHSLNFVRYSGIDHFIMHSVPHYGDKPADSAIISDRAPIIGVLDLKMSSIRKSPWTLARSVVVPFITLKTRDNIKTKRTIPAFVAMSTSTKGLRAASGLLRQRIEQQMRNVSGAEVFVINRRMYSTFKAALETLPEKMSHSELCVIPPGDAPSSKRFYDAISYCCIPFSVSDYFVLPYEDVYIDYQTVMKQLPAANVDELAGNLGNFSRREGREMRKALEKVRERFTWDYREKPRTGQALWSLSWALYDRFRMIQPYLHNEMTGYDLDPNFSIEVHPS
jgi:hypothetical protein